jgi:hypothetical protein
MQNGVFRKRRQRLPARIDPIRGVIEVTMFEPVLHHLHHAPLATRWIAQLVQLDPELAAALPLLAARLMDAGGIDEDDEEGCEAQEPIAV